MGKGLSFMVSYLRYQKLYQNGGFEVVQNSSGLPVSSWITDGKMEILEIWGIPFIIFL